MSSQASEATDASLEKIALVTRVEAGRAYLKLEAESGCGRCTQVGGCGSRVLSDILGARCSLISIVDDQGLQPGDKVRLVAPTGSLLRSAGWAYGLPLLLGVFVAAVGSVYGDALAATGLVTGVVLGWWVGAGLIKTRRAHGLGVEIQRL
jgi:sigma-E factor negative regulatory protein RseC